MQQKYNYIHLVLEKYTITWNSFVSGWKRFYDQTLNASFSAQIFVQTSSITCHFGNINLYIFFHMGNLFSYLSELLL